MELSRSGRERSVYLSRQAERTLKAYLTERPSAPSDFVFLSYQLDGMSTTTIHKRLICYREQYGEHLTTVLSGKFAYTNLVVL